MSPRLAGLLLLAALGTVGWWLLRWPELLAVAVGLLVFALLALGFRMPRAATWTDIDTPTRVERGSRAEVTIGIEISGATRWVSACDETGSSRQWVESAGPSTLSWPVDTSRRGSYLVGPTHLAFADPFGLRHRVLAERQPSPVLVVPRVSEVPPIMLAASEAEGALVERAGVEQFHSVREYSTGDPLKLIHWRATARTGTLMVRRLVDTTTPTIAVILDTAERSYDATGSAFADFSPDLFEEAVDLAASHAWQQATAAHHVLLTTTTAGAPVLDVTARNRASALDWLALVQPTGQAASPARVIELLRRRPAAAIVLVTGNHAPTAALERSWRRWAPVTVARSSS